MSQFKQVCRKQKEGTDRKNFQSVGCGFCSWASLCRFSGYALFYFRKFCLHTPFRALSGGRWAEPRLCRHWTWMGPHCSDLSLWRNGPKVWKLSLGKAILYWIRWEVGSNWHLELLALVWHSLLLLKLPVFCGCHRRSWLHLGMAAWLAKQEQQWTAFFFLSSAIPFAPLSKTRVDRDTMTLE